MIVYATTQQLTDWLGDDPPANAQALLRSATFRVALACNLNPYDQASGPDVPEPLTDATCAQVAYWIANNVTPADAATAVAALVKRSSMLGDWVEFDTAASSKLAIEAASALAPEAEAILTVAGLLWVPMPLSDTSGDLASWGLTGTPLSAMLPPPGEVCARGLVDAWWLS